MLHVSCYIFRDFNHLNITPNFLICFGQNINLIFILSSGIIYHYAPMLELADRYGLGPYAARRGGSSPPRGTNQTNKPIFKEFIKLFARIKRRRLTTFGTMNILTVIFCNNLGINGFTAKRAMNTF